MEGRTTAVPKDAHLLFPKTCDHITTHGKRDFADLNKVRILRWGIFNTGIV
jgi:hypothetical protein